MIVIMLINKQILLYILDFVRFYFEFFHQKWFNLNAKKFWNQIFAHLKKSDEIFDHTIKCIFTQAFIWYMNHFCRAKIPKPTAFHLFIPEGRAKGRQRRPDCEFRPFWIGWNKKICSRNHNSWNTSNTSLGKIQKEKIRSRLLLQVLRYVVFWKSCFIPLIWINQC